MKKTNSIIWGIALIAVGVIFALSALGIAEIDLLFRGWWTLFLIVPGISGLVKRGDKTWPLIITLIGVLLLLGARNIISYELAGSLIIPGIIIVIGARFVFKGMFNGKAEKRKMRVDDLKKGLPAYSAIFGGQNVSFSGLEFSGAELNSVFGGIELDLRQTIINDDCVIELSAIFGGVDIYVPDNVRVDVSSLSLFGGISDKTKKQSDENAHVIYVNGTCMFGGADIK